MFNLIKMDLNRLFRTTSFAVGLILSAIISFLCISILSFFMGMIDNPEAVSESAGLLMVDWKANGIFLTDLIKSSFNILSLLISTSLTAIFVNAEQSSGYIKNIAGQIPNKSMIAVSKFFSIVVINFAIFIVYFAVSALSGLLFFSSMLKAGDFISLLIALAVKFLLYIAVDTIILFVCTLTKSKTLAVAIGVVFGIGISKMIYNMLDTFLNMVFKVSDINLAIFTPDGMNSVVDAGTETDVIIRGIVVAVIYIAIFLIASGAIMKNRDIK